MSEPPRESAPQLTRALTLRDLVLFNLAAVVGLTWTGTAAKAGASGLTLWLVASVVFFIPQGLAVVELSAAHPEEGGVYAWTKREFGEGHGFLCGWCYWICNVLFYPSLLLTVAVSAAYAVGMGDTGLGEDWRYVLPFTMTALWLAALVNVFGLGTGKWLQNAGGVGNYVAGLILILLGLYAALASAPANDFSAQSFLPVASDFSALNLWATIPFAYAGLELSSTMGSEIENPRKNLPRSIFLAAPVAAGLYVLGTGAVLWLLPAAEINITSAPFHAASVGASMLSPSLLWLANLMAAAATLGRLGGLGAWLSGPARVAFVVGLDRYFPAAFGRVHPRYRTPHVAILVQAALATLFTLFGVLGKGTTVERAFLTLIDMSLLLYFIPFSYLFVCYIRHARRADELRTKLPGGRATHAVLGACGLLTTLFAMGVAIIPPPGADAGLFTLKVVGGTCLLVLVSGVIYWRAKRQQLREV
jgi:amino acid transporter